MMSKGESISESAYHSSQPIPNIWNFKDSEVSVKARLTARRGAVGAVYHEGLMSPSQTTRSRSMNRTCQVENQGSGSAWH